MHGCVSFATCETLSTFIFGMYVNASSLLLLAQGTHDAMINIKFPAMGIEKTFRCVDSFNCDPVTAHFAMIFVDWTIFSTNLADTRNLHKG